MSMLFPMERLFERYVLGSLRMIAPNDFEIHPQHGAMHLCSQEGEDWFQMKPDILVRSGDQRWIIDAKWKRLSTDRDKNYELSQADFYQLFAYGQKYLGGAGEMFLVYPAVSDFPMIRTPFKLSDNLLLHVLPFDLERRQALTPSSGANWAPSNASDRKRAMQILSPTSGDLEHFNMLMLQDSEDRCSGHVECGFK